MAFSLLLAAAMVVSAPTDDTVTLPDGRILHGHVVRQYDRNVWLEHEVDGRTITDFYADCAVQRDPARVEPKDTIPPPAPGKPKAVVITLGDNETGNMLGEYVTAEELRQMIPLLHEDLGDNKDAVVVLRVHSGGGLFSEVQPVSDVLEAEYKLRWRTICWVETAVARSAMAVYGVQEKYFTNHANFGAVSCSQPYLGDPWEIMDPVKQREVDAALSTRGHHDPLILQAMNMETPLSVEIDEQAVPHFFPDATTGHILLNRAREGLTLTAKTAQQIGFSRGTADTLPDLTKALVADTLDWIGDRTNITNEHPWPVCKAEAWNIAWKKSIRQDERRLQDAFAKFRRNADGLPDAADGDARAFQLMAARQGFQEVQDIVAAHSIFKRTVFGSVEHYDQFVKDGTRQLARPEKGGSK